jgi:hypothetical protein
VCAVRRTVHGCLGFVRSRCGFPPLTTSTNTENSTIRHNARATRAVME